MKLSPHWIRDFVDLSVDDKTLAEALTNVGLGVEGILGSGADTVFEMEIGTNRPDAMNHYGVAREAAAIYDRELKAIEPKLPSATEAGSSGGHRDAALKGLSSTASRTATGSGIATAPLAATHASAPEEQAEFRITVEEPDLCPRFTSRIIRNTKIKPSSEKIAHRLQLLDQRPISNAVDATNYVLWEIGKPTHVFDMDLLEGEIIVRKAREGEILKTLDGVVRKLTPEDMVVADAKKPVGLAGVMGGYDTMITEKTCNILIESAWWDPATVRKASRRHALHTDASHRFERGADFESTALSCDRVAEIIVQSGGGEPIGGLIDVVSKKMDQAPIILHIAEVHRILGGGIESGEVFRILKKLGFGIIPEGMDVEQFRVHIPSWRLDVEREIDLIEEIARLHGYNKFPNTLPAYSGAVVELPNAAKDATLRERSLALGYNEAISLTFISHADAERFSSAAILELENPQSEEASVMRSSLVPGMLDMLAWNLNRGSENARLFEMGPVYELANSERVEPHRACLGATLTAIKSVIPAAAMLDVSKGEHAVAAEAFRSFKGDVENLLAAFDCQSLTFDRQVADYYHPGRSARALVDGKPVVQFGQIHPEVAAARKLRQDVYVAEFDLDQLYRSGLRRPHFEPLPKYPAVERDFSFIFADGVSFEQLRNAVYELRIPELRDFCAVEIFRGGSVAAGKYSILLRATFQSGSRTLREEEIADWSGQIVRALQAIGGTQRA